MEPTDIQLMLRVREGDLEAFQALVQRHRASLRRFLAAMLKDAESAEDAVQETLLRLWLLRGRYEPTAAFSTYLFQIARNHAMNARKRLYRDACQKAWNMDDLAEGDSPEGVLLQRETSSDVEEAIRSLPPLYRTVFLMSHRDGLKYAEIGAHLRIPVGTVKSRMAEAVKRLRRLLQDGKGEG
jgi:RNA polymerase sigma-70 factor (ECF subfamily)